MQLHILRLLLLEPLAPSAALQSKAALQTIHVLGIRPQELALLLKTADKLMCARRPRVLACEGKLSDERVEYRGCRRVQEERGREEVFASDERRGVARFDERVESVG